MKLVSALSNPLSHGSEWISERFINLLSVARFGAGANGLGLDFFSGITARRTWSGSAVLSAGLRVVSGRTRLQISPISRSVVGCRQRPVPYLMSADKGVSAKGSMLRADDLLQDLIRNPPADLSPVRRRQRDKAIELMRTETLIEAALSFNIVELESELGEEGMQLGGEVLPVPESLPKSGELNAFGCGAYTLGPRIEARVRTLFGEKKTALALALDALANELQLSLGRRMRNELLADVMRRRLVMGQRLIFGESESDLSVQAALLRLAGAGDIGINLQQGALRSPQKSSIEVFAVGRDLPMLALARYRG